MPLVGPRSRDRGNVASRRMRQRPGKLQWGRGRATAEIRLRHHYSWAAEMRNRYLDWWRIHLASMGPRSRDRGNVLCGFQAFVKPPDSMGTRSRDRGNGDGLDAIEALLDGFNGAAVARPRKWSACDGVESVTIRFNGAAVARPRKCEREYRIDNSVARLQWGRGRATAEISSLATGVAELCQASMGPRSRDRGNLAPVGPSHDTFALQWGRGRATAEIAYHLSYSIFNDLWDLTRAVPKSRPSIRSL